MCISDVYIYVYSYVYIDVYIYVFHMCILMYHFYSAGVPGSYFSGLLGPDIISEASTCVPGSYVLGLLRSRHYLGRRSVWTPTLS
jgi:hypothetical protein